MAVRVFLAAGAIWMNLLIAPAFGQSNCGSRGPVVEQLREQYGEQQTAFGIMPDGALVELYTSVHGSFTIVVTSVFGLSCVTLFGEDWERKDGKVFELERFPSKRVH